MGSREYNRLIIDHPISNNIKKRAKNSSNDGYINTGNSGHSLPSLAEVEKDEDKADYF
jgi:hypothetical protein